MSRVAHSFGAAGVLLAYRRGAVDAKRNVMIAPNVVFSDAVAQFGRAVSLDDRDCGALEQQLADHAGVNVAELQIERLVGERKAALLVIHDEADREVPFRHGERLVAAWRHAKLQATHGLGHRRILRDDQVIAEAVAFLQYGVSPPASELVREVDRLLAEAGEAGNGGDGTGGM
jgi:pimeloyl-ACP methyl ester carboxylesterase